MMDWAALRGRWFRSRETGGSGPASRPRVAVVTDSSCSLPEQWAETPALASLVRVVSMPVMIGDQIYGEGTDKMIGALALALAQGREVRTSRPSPGAFEAVYAELAAAGFEAVVSVHLSSKLSGTVDSARLAARSAALPVQVVDTASVAMGLGYAVQAAARAALGGAGVDDVVAAARASADAAHILFYVPSLDQLRRGGRIGAAAGWLGTLFAVKPILAIRDGLVVPLERVRTAPRALARLQELCREELARRPGPVRVAVHHFGNEAEAERLAAAVVHDAPEADVILCPLPAVLAAHAGLGVLAVAVAPSTPAGPASGAEAGVPDVQPSGAAGRVRGAGAAGKIRAAGPAGAGGRAAEGSGIGDQPAHRPADPDGDID
ncbi:DegV family protein [Arthrobacter gandavensis]|uniref:DegV family protein n=1 Tax=Arthrobacter gandavensis TaxID=169960 RepID=UPI00188E68B5|nr:DegV family protein [Arthrobacter gandavensis]MBF4995251.1 DegV family protein [Arthrobacter gandavensis]